LVHFALTSNTYDHDDLQAALNDLETHQMLARTTNNRLQLTELGFLAGESSVSVSSIIRFIECLTPLTPNEINDLELLVTCQIAEELDRVIIPIHKTSIKERNKWPSELRNQGVCDRVIESLRYNAKDQAAITARMKKSMAAIAYISDTKLEDIEIFLLQHMRKSPISGAIRQTADRTCDILPTVAQVAEYLHPDQNLSNKADILLARLATGANAKMAFLASHTGTKLTRGDYLTLMNAGFTSFEILEKADDSTILQYLGTASTKLTSIKDAIIDAKQDEGGEGISLKPYQSAG
jgi:helicase